LQERAETGVQDIDLIFIYILVWMEKRPDGLWILMPMLVARVEMG
jgi:hypothetical protein